MALNLRRWYKIRKWNRNLRNAKRRWAKVVASSVYNDMRPRERRQLMKQTLRDIGYKRIRLIERSLPK